MGPGRWWAELGVSGLMWSEWPQGLRFAARVNYALLDCHRQLQSAQAMPDNVVAALIESECACTGQLENYAASGRKLPRIARSLNHQNLFGRIETWFNWRLQETDLPEEWRWELKEAKTMDATIDVVENFRTKFVQQGREEGREEGREQGVLLGQANLLLSMARFKFGVRDVSDFELELRRVKDLETLHQVGDWVIQYETLGQVMEKLSRAMKK